MKIFFVLLVIGLCSQVHAQLDAQAEELKDEATLVVEEKQVEEVVKDLKADEAEVVASPDEKTEIAEEADVKHDEKIEAVQEDDVDELMLDIKDDELDVDADVLEKKLDDLRFLREQNGKTDAERRQLEMERKKRRNALRKAKHDNRRRKHLDRHAKVDSWLAEMRKEHPENKVKRSAVMEDLIEMIRGEHASVQSIVAKR